MLTGGSPDHGRTTRRSNSPPAVLRLEAHRHLGLAARQRIRNRIGHGQVLAGPRAGESLGRDLGAAYQDVEGTVGVTAPINAVQGGGLIGRDLQGVAETALGVTPVGEGRISAARCRVVRGQGVGGLGGGFANENTVNGAGF